MHPTLHIRHPLHATIQAGYSVNEPISNGRLTLLLITTLSLVATVGIADLLLDAPESLLSAHVAFELVTIGLSLGIVVYFWQAWRSSRRELAVAREAVAAGATSHEAWRRRSRALLVDLGQAIDEQFDDWHLTPSEREVTLLLLKGHSHKLIAHETDRSERTVRQHAVAAYRKAGISGRAELAAYFLGDLPLPDSEIPPRTGGISTKPGMEL